MAILQERSLGTIFTHQKPFIPASGTIGVSGITANAGATHLCIALANFLCSKFYSDTAYLEMNGSHAIHALSRNPHTDAPFVHQRITYYPDMTLAALPEVLSRHYKYYVLDFGGPNPHTAYAFERCGIRLVIGSVSPWKREQFIKSVRNSFYNMKNKEENVYLGNLMERKSDVEQIEKDCGIRIVPVPFFPNPFRITSKDFTFFEKILGGN